MIDRLAKVVREAEALGAEQAEAYALISRARRVRVERSALKMADSRTSAGVGVRVIWGGRVGFSYATSLAESELRRAVEVAISVAKARAGPKSLDSFAPPEKPPSVPGIYCEETAEASLDDLAALAAHAVDAAKGHSDLVTAVNAELSVRVEERHIANSLGLEASAKSTVASLAVMVTAEDAGRMSTSMDFQSSRGLSGIDCEAVAASAAKFSTMLLEGEKVGLLRGPAILDPIAVSVLVASMLSYALSAENVQSGRSFLKGLLGSEVASSGLRVTDDPLIEGAVASRPFDGEGVPSKRVAVVDGGVLKSYLHNLSTAYREGTESTGHASRGYASEPGVAPSNLVFTHERERPLSDLLSEAEGGVYVRFVLGAHTFNRATGDFSVVASEAFLIEGGELGRPVRQAAFSGNLLELLRKAYAMSRERRWVGSVSTGALAVEEAMIVS